MHSHCFAYLKNLILSDIAIALIFLIKFPNIGISNFVNPRDLLIITNIAVAICDFCFNLILEVSVFDMFAELLSVI